MESRVLLIQMLLSYLNSMWETSESLFYRKSRFFQEFDFFLIGKNGITNFPYTKEFYSTWTSYEKFWERPENIFDREGGHYKSGQTCFTRVFKNRPRTWRDLEQKFTNPRTKSYIFLIKKKNFTDSFKYKKVFSPELPMIKILEGSENLF